MRPSDSTRSKKMALLKSIALFAALDEADLIRLTSELQLREYEKGEIIFRQGDPSREVFIVTRGRVRIFRITPSGNQTSITLFGNGDLIGELAAIDKEARSATAQAVLPSALLQLSAERFRDYMQNNKFALGLIQLLSTKLRWTAAYAETVAQYGAAGRLLHILLLYNQQFGQETERGKRFVLDLGLNQEDLASLVGVRRERVNRLLATWQKRGLLEYSAGKITILDLARLSEERDHQIEATAQQEEW